ncbi:hypothetical protein QAO71_10465 [Halopseudomonas sp. SMJS2]|uniref:hypothetical protein n=1 Tax=Halopseudomonas sp. SMJS2 TaxID=3041098 RepID=UPI002452CFEE|nr:hypothetical protein [Halopseudomonas sp. SMJS2]WGK60516.1 hypothetical protein QAO71_10465 [Halopseudomonas sp. SMJS2]
MRWMVGLAVLALCIICGLLGLTAGINLNPDSTVRFVPLWGSVGDWFAGVGTSAAVIVTLWLAEVRRKEMQPKVRIVTRFGDLIVKEKRTVNVFVRIISCGGQPANVTGVSIRSPHTKQVVSLRSTVPVSTDLPANLGYGQVATLIYELPTLVALAVFVREKCGGRSNDLEICVQTTLEEFYSPIDLGIIKEIAKRV